MNKILDSVFKTTNYSTNEISLEINELTDIFLNSPNFNKKKKTLINNRILIIVPGYSVSYPPRIGHHLHYINALEYQLQNNPLGYKKIYLFDIYSKKDGRCNFKLNIPQLAKELFSIINEGKEDWSFEINGEIDFIGASMGGLIVRKMIKDYMKKDNIIQTNKWGNLKIKNVLLIATPNFGCKIIDLLQNPIIKFIIRLRFGKDNFSNSEQFLQIRAGNIPLFGPIIRTFIKRKSVENEFLLNLNSSDFTPGTIRWITIRGTKNIVFTKFLYHEITNDGVVEAEKVPLSGAENICDFEVKENTRWNHRDLYMAPSVCRLLFGILVLQLKLHQYNSLLSIWLHSIVDKNTLHSYSQNQVNYFNTKKKPTVIN